MKSKKQPKLKVQYFLAKNSNNEFYIVFEKKLAILFYNDSKEYAVEISSMQSVIKQILKQTGKPTTEKTFFKNITTFSIQEHNMNLLLRIYDHILKKAVEVLSENKK